MKTFLALFLAVGSATAQTNLGFISFTNKAGVYIELAMVTRVDDTDLYYRVEGVVGGGSIPLEKLSTADQKRFGYQPEKAAAKLKQKNEQKQKLAKQDQIVLAQLSSQQELNQRRREMEKKATILLARIIQRTGGKLLVDCSGTGGGQNWKGYVPTPAYKQFMKGKTSKEEWEWQKERSTVLLLDCNEPNIADGDGIIVIAYPVGTYEYDAVSGGKKTVRKYTCDIDVAISQ